METVRVQCPCCWQSSDIVIDDTVENQEYYEDCEICCRPMHIQVARIDDKIEVVANSEDD
ncbi:MAG: CPXCG motif-containing cysteine-rich protein [Chitinivibrionales bacterium]|nr:CPXCG motif-containing cysteine-rich protein [Chitinivibrionales bacterium]